MKLPASRPGPSPCRLGLVLAFAALVLAGCEQAGGASRTVDTADGLAGDLRLGESRPGDLALDYVTDLRYPGLVLEVDYMEGAAPSEDALLRLSRVLERRLRKPQGVFADVAAEPIPAAWSQAIYADEDIWSLETQFRDHFTGDARNQGLAVIWVLYVEGVSEHEDALGLALGGSQVAIFPDAVDRALLEGSPEARESAEVLVLLHEVGHLLGLVNNGLPMVEDHEDPLHPYHDSNPRCVMHYRVELGWLERAPALDFDYACRRDLWAAGGPDPGAPDDDPLPHRLR